MLPHELFGSSGTTITSCGRHTNEFSSVRYATSRGAEVRIDVEHKKLNKSCSKAW